ncbi:hypothetical protein MKW92_030736 [Papaver armeniacum]|nr:hypothetical protein MKW92_030736 [Papaver armeniacum]
MKMNAQLSISEMIFKSMMIILCFSVYGTSARNFIIGGESGWALDSDVQSWSSSHTFNVGDTLVFVYQPIHNVLEVKASDYKACNLDNPMYIHNGTSTSITLDTLSTRYFICGTQGHCMSGLKVKIEVNSNGTAVAAPHRHPLPPLPPRIPPSNFPPFSAATKKTKNLMIITCLMALLLVMVV